MTNSGLNVKDIAVIGAGPCGAGLTKALLGEKAFNKIKVYEKRDKFGGLWNYTPNKTQKVERNEFPATETNKQIEKVQGPDGERFFESPVYNLLDANVPKDLMAYRDYPFGDDVPLFPTRAQILKYIEDYSKDIEPYVTFNERVIDTRYLQDQKKWVVVSKSLITEEETTEFFDAVAVAVGSYDQPFVPDVAGIKEWSEKYPYSITHAKNYDGPQQFENSKTILVVGNSASGGDIAYQLATHLDRVIYKSIRSENRMPAGADERIHDVQDLLKFDPVTKTIYFKDGFKLENVDSVIFATGYLKSIPFIKEEPLITNGLKVHGLYEHLIYYTNPTLAVIGLPRFVLPTRLSETQGCWLARVWSGRIQLPSIEEMERSSNSHEGKELTHHDLVFPRDVEYSNQLNNQALQAKGEYGYYAVHWDERQTQIRGAIKFIKQGYIKFMADKKRPAYSLEELEAENYIQYPTDETN